MNLPQNAGLGAMMQAKGASSAGVPKQSMNEMMALAQKLPDSELADVLAGKSVRVPQFAAMLAAMGRDSLRTAVAGAQAGQAKEPSKKDQMLAKMSPQPQAPAGLETLPAPNMAQMGQGMASGGIVAFSGEDGSVVTDPQTQADRDALLATGRYILDAAGNIIEAPFRALGSASDFFINRPLRAMGVPIPRVPSQFRYGAEEPSVTSAVPTAGETIGPQGMAPLRQPAPEAASGSAGTPPPGNQPPGVAPRAPGVGAPSPAVQQPQMPEGRKSPIDELMAPTEDVAKQIAASKNQAQGEFLMQIGASLMSTPNLGVALSKGAQAGLPGLAANRKEINAIQKDQRDYRLNLSKAQEAAAQGKDDLAFKYADLAEKAQYHAGMIGAAMTRGNAGDSRIATAAMAQARAQLAEVLKNPRLSRNYATPEAQSAYLNDAFNSALSILSGQGPVTPSIPTYGAPPSGAVTRE